VATIKESISLAKDETILREYYPINKQGFPLISSGIEGRIAVTNKRIIGRSETLGGHHIKFTSIPLDKAVGTCLYSGSHMLLIPFLIGVLVIIAGILALIMVHSRSALAPGIIGILVGIVLILFSFRNEIHIGVRAATIVGKGGMVSIPDYNGYLLLSAHGFTLFQIHGPDAEAVMKGLDAVILDAQERGSQITQDLKCPNPNCHHMIMIDEKPPKHCPECGIAWGEK
jgi:hypothetical protein